MGFVSEIRQTMGRAYPLVFVSDAELGLFFRNGRITKREISAPMDRLEEILAAEQEVLKSNGGFWNCLPFFPIEMPEDYGRSLLGQPRHPDRYSSQLPAGRYLVVPWFDKIQKFSTQDTVLNIDQVTVPIENGNTTTNITIGGTTIYHVVDAEKVLTVRNHPNAVGEYTRGCINDAAVGKGPAYWNDGDNKRLFEKEVLTQLNQQAEHWGLEATSFRTTDIVIARGIRLLSDRPPRDGGTVRLPYR